MDAIITKKDVYLLAIPLPKPIRLGFGELHHLPRVFLSLQIEGNNGKERVSVGEASIDFPFSHYDAWDIF